MWKKRTMGKRMGEQQMKKKQNNKSWGERKKENSNGKNVV